MHVPAKPRLKSKLIDLMTGTIDDENTLVAYQEDCAVMYLTLDADENDPDGVSLLSLPFLFLLYSALVYVCERGAMLVRYFLED